MNYIKKVGKDFFDQLDVDPDVYVKEIVAGVCKFDFMVILLSCVLHNVHTMVLLHKSCWTTRHGHDYSMTYIKLAYVGDGVLKFIVPLETSSNEQADASNKEPVDARSRTVTRY